MSRFVCSSCGATSPSWVGKCPECSVWNSYAEEAEAAAAVIKGQKPRVESSAQPVTLSQIVSSNEKRMPSGINELDRVLGGGIIAGSAILVSGEPGIGKSTLLLQLAGSLSKKSKVLYISGEESPHQIKIRADRLAVTSAGLVIFPGTDISEIIAQIDEQKPDHIIVDSIQTIEMREISSGAGSVSQVKECATLLVKTAKEKNIPTFIVGQVTKDGSVAGPKILEHMVDTVLYFEGEKTRQFRILRAVKNRFGSTNEIGMFEMTDKGLIEVTNPSKILLDEGSLGEAGSAITVAIEGTRPVLIEVQALLSYSRLASPRRVISGLDYNRSSLIMGVLERKAGVKISDHDAFLSVTAGLYVEEPAIDLAIAMAIVSCGNNKGLDPKTIYLGEIGLTGEIRSVTQIEQRLSEAAKLGFTTAVVPKASMDQIKVKGIKIVGVSNVKEAVTA